MIFGSTYNSFRGIILTTALLSISTTGANAKKVDAETPLLLLGFDPTSVVSVLKRDDSIITTRMTYAILAEASEDIKGFDVSVMKTAPETLSARGSQLFGIISRNGQRTYCNIDHKTVGTMEGVFVINSNKHRCFVDADGDGKFEISYDLRTKFSPYVPLYYDVEVSGNALSSPAGYSAIDPSECKLLMWLDIYVKRIFNKGYSAEIGVRIRTEDRPLPLTFTKRVSLTDRGANLEILGSRFTLSYKDEKALAVNIIRGIPRQGFSTQRPEIHYNVFFY